MKAFPVEIQPGVVRNMTPAGVGPHWYDSHLMRWVSGRMRPILGWEHLVFDNFAAGFQSPIRYMHRWVDRSGVERIGVLCERHLYVVEASGVYDVSPLEERNLDTTVRHAAGIKGPSNSLTGGYGNDLYDTGLYDQARTARTDVRKVGEIWRLANWGEDLIAMASTDGRLLRWKPGDANADRVKGQDSGSTAFFAPEGNRTFVITPERYVILFGMEGRINKFGWCSQENIEDWDFANTQNEAGVYEVEPMSRIIDAQVARYTTIFWTVQGAYVIEYKALPYIYTYAYLGSHAGPLSGQAAAVYSGTVIWPALDGFWQFDGSAVSQVPCPVLDWFQQNLDDRNTRAHMAGWFNGAASEVWWCFPSRGRAENNKLIVYNFEERWWSLGELDRTCGVPGTLASYPVMANTTTLFRHEKGNLYPGAALPWIRSGQIAPDGQGAIRATTKQLVVDTDAPLNAVTYQLFATKGRYAGAEEYTKGPKLPRLQGKIDYRITGRDFSVKMASTTAGLAWSFGKGQILLAPRGEKLADPRAATMSAPAMVVGSQGVR
jgi:hypothetical protein